jgi:SMI1 / KNR4 family (SUKH-1)
MLTINKKTDILVPFQKIGQPDWTVNTREILTAIADNYGDDLKEPVTAADIAVLEKRLGTALPEGLKLFYQAFGIADIGEQLQELKQFGWIKEIWAEKPQYGPSFTEEDKQWLPFLVSFSDYLGNGNMFCFHSETKEIYYYDHDQRPYLSKIFNSVDDYLKGCLIFAQADLFGAAKQEEVEIWTEELVTEILGKEIVQKWRY